jgi:hypothetical protein
MKRHASPWKSTPPTSHEGEHDWPAVCINNAAHNVLRSMIVIVLFNI